MSILWPNDLTTGFTCPDYTNAPATTSIPDGDDDPADAVTTPATRLLDLTSPSAFADQTQSTLMTIQRELRNKIYGHVFEYNLDTREATTEFKGEEEGDHEVEISYPPTRIFLCDTPPTSKGAILPCRQLYLKMRNMQSAAHRAYWCNNIFMVKASWMHGMPDDYDGIPSDRDLQHIRHFSIYDGSMTMLDMIFDAGEWNARVFPSVGKPLGPEDFGNDQDLFDEWCTVQILTETAADYVWRPRAGDNVILDPRAGRGPDSEEIFAFLSNVVPCRLYGWAESVRRAKVDLLVRTL